MLMVQVFLLLFVIVRTLRVIGPDASAIYLLRAVLVGRPETRSGTASAGSTGHHCRAVCPVLQACPVSQRAIWHSTTGTTAYRQPA